MNRPVAASAVVVILAALAACAGDDDGGTAETDGTSTEAAETSKAATTTGTPESTEPRTTDEDDSETETDAHCTEIESTITVTLGPDANTISGILILEYADGTTPLGEADTGRVVMEPGVNTFTVPTPAGVATAWLEPGADPRCSLDTLGLRVATADDLAATATSTTAVPPTTAAPTPVTVEQMDAIIGPAANAWLANPSGATYDALSAAVMTLVQTYAAGAGLQLPSPQAAAAIDALRTYPGTDNRVIGYLADLGLPSVALPSIVPLGSYLVGSEVQPGTYRAQDVVNCYWETLDEAGEINNNNFVNAAPQVLATVNPSDFAFNNDCALMVKVD